MATVQTRIEEVIKYAATGTIFSIYDFVPYGNYESAKKALLRAEKRGELKRILNGLYYKPGLLYTHPPMDDIARAIALKFGWTIAPSGEECLRKLGLSDTQKTENRYLSSGPGRTYTIFGEYLAFTHTTSRDIVGLSAMSITVVQALKEYGRGNIPDIILEKISSRLTNEEKETLFKETSSTTTWVHSDITRMLTLFP